MLRVSESLRFRIDLSSGITLTTPLLATRTFALLIGLDVAFLGDGLRF